MIYFRISRQFQTNHVKDFIYDFLSQVLAIKLSDSHTKKADHLLPHFPTNHVKDFIYDFLSQVLAIKLSEMILLRMI